MSEVKITSKRCRSFGKEPDDNYLYGSFSDTDALVDSTNVEDRIRMAKMGYGVDKLKDDRDFRVRVEVAKGGYYPQQFIKDSYPAVRKAAQQYIKV